MKQFELHELLNFVKYENFNTQELKVKDLGAHFSKLINILKKTEVKVGNYCTCHLPVWLSFEKESELFLKEHYLTDYDNDQDLKEDMEYINEILPNQTQWFPSYVKSYKDYNEIHIYLGKNLLTVNIKEDIIYINYQNKIDSSKVYEFSSNIEVLKFLRWITECLEMEYSKILENRIKYYKEKDKLVSWQFRYSKIKILDYVKYAKDNGEEIYLFGELTESEIFNFLNKKNEFIESSNDAIKLTKHKMLEIIQKSMSVIDASNSSITPFECYQKCRRVRDYFHNPEEKDEFAEIGEFECDFELWFENRTEGFHSDFLVGIGGFGMSIRLAPYKIGDKFKIRIINGDSFHSASGAIRIATALQEIGLPVSIEETSNYFNYLNGDTYIGVEPHYSIGYKKEGLDIENVDDVCFSFFKSSSEIIRHKIPKRYIDEYKIDAYFS